MDKQAANRIVLAASILGLSIIAAAIILRVSNGWSGDGEWQFHPQTPVYKINSRTGETVKIDWSGR